MKDFPFPLPPVILASKSPRRQELLAGMGIDFRVGLRDVDENYPPDLSPLAVAQYIAQKKMDAFTDETDALVITADTIVIAGTEILGKPSDAADARRMLRLLAGKMHEVVTGICIRYKEVNLQFSDRTLVHFKEINDIELDYYIENFQPFDKAGAYGIQEWIGLTKIERIEGSYANVVGLPTAMLYDFLLIAAIRAGLLKRTEADAKIISVDLYPPDLPV